jgi:response regulator RpfG family c-di-GMP phosphodiesterase
VRLLLTGYADIGSTIAAINQGEIHRYIAKPWNDPDLLLTVQEALRRRQLELENQRLLAQVQAQNQALAELNQGLEQRVKARTAEIEQINDMLEKAYEELNENFMVAVTVFSGLLEMREGAVAGHARRVAALVKRMGPHLGSMNGRSRRSTWARCCTTSAASASRTACWASRCPCWGRRTSCATGTIPRTARPR